MKYLVELQQVDNSSAYIKGRAVINAAELLHDCWLEFGLMKSKSVRRVARCCVSCSIWNYMTRSLKNILKSLLRNQIACKGLMDKCGPNKLPNKRALNIHEVLSGSGNWFKQNPAGAFLSESITIQYSDIYADKDQLIQAYVKYCQKCVQAMKGKGNYLQNTHSQAYELGP